MWVVKSETSAAYLCIRPYNSVQARPSRRVHLTGWLKIRTEEKSGMRRFALPAGSAFLLVASLILGAASVLPMIVLFGGPGGKPVIGSTGPGPELNTGSTATKKTMRAFGSD